MEHSLATLMGPLYDHHHPPTLAGGRTVQQRDPSTTGKDYWQPARLAGAELGIADILRTDMSCLRCQAT